MKKSFFLTGVAIAVVVLSGCANGHSADRADTEPTPPQQVMPTALDEAVPMDDDTMDAEQDIVITTDVAPIDQIDSPDTLLKDVDTMMDSLDEF